MSDFLRGYFRDSLTYLEYLQQHGSAATMAQPTHWIKAWLDGFRSTPEEHASSAAAATADALPRRVDALEQRIRELEAAAAAAGEKTSHRQGGEPG